MKLAVIGGGGVRSMFLAKSIAQSAARLGIAELAFMDNDPVKLGVYGAMAREVARRIDPNLRFVLTTDPVAALDGASYAITTIRAGGDDQRVVDEMIALDLDLLGQETTGAAGFSFAMRSIPALMDYCELVKRHAAPGCKVFNFTNPAGLVSQALRDAGYDFTYGICDAPSGLLHALAKQIGAEPNRVSGTCYGLNHLSFIPSVTLDGREILPELIADPRTYQATDMRFFEPELVARLGELPNEYMYYFFYGERAIRNIKAAGVTRGQVIARINGEMTAELHRMDPVRDFDACLARFEHHYDRRERAYMQNETGGDGRKDAWKFDIHSPDAGGYAGVALKYIECAQTGGAGRMILCMPNEGGAIAGLEPDDVVEISCDVDGAKLTPDRFPNPKPIPMSYIRRVKLYERLGAEAIVRRDLRLAQDALMVHPLVNSRSLAGELVGKYVRSNADYIEGWK